MSRACIACGGSEFQSVIDLGDQYVVDFVKNPELPALKAPLHLQKCVDCHLVQLKDRVSPDRLYRTFWYRSGINESMRQALRDVVRSLKTESQEKVLDIGCNDGTLLAFYPKGTVKVGIDPCRELLDEGLSEKRIDIGIVGYFSKKAIEQYGPYKAITAISMFYDVDNPQQFLEDCRDVLAPEGTLVIQMNYLKTMLEDLAFDNICHEHLAYYSMTAMKSLIEKAGLECQGAMLNSVNGGSLRVYITHPGGLLNKLPIGKQVELHAMMHSLLISEANMKLDTDIPYKRFRDQVQYHCQLLRKFILSQKDVCVYGASTRGHTLMQCLNLPQGTIKYAAERDEKKWGLYTVGTNILIQDETFCRSNTKLFLVLPWHFAGGIRSREHAWMQNGGRLLFPMPTPYLVMYDETIDEQREIQLMEEVIQ